MAKAKRSYSTKTLKILFAQSGNRCAFPGCPTPVVWQEDGDREVAVTGEIGHILPASAGGPRGKGNRSREGLNDPNNLIILCPTHHTVVDTQPGIYNTEVLRAWKRSQHALSSRSKRSDLVEISRLPSTDGDVLGRTTEIARLNETWRSKRFNVVSIMGVGGLGKSALVNHWLSSMERSAYYGARVYGWSFYHQGTTHEFATSNEFLEAALIWFGDAEPLAGDEADKGRRLATLVRTRPTILVLDGLEPLQSPPGPKAGEITDPALKSLLTSLASDNPGLCIVTTRYRIASLDRFRTNVDEFDLGGLSGSAGSQLLRTLGVRGDRVSLEQAVAEFAGHPLALHLLGTFLRDVHGGAVERRVDIPIREWDSEQGGKARRMMQSYKHWLGEGPAMQILGMLGLFDRPADAAALSALRQAPHVRGLTDGTADPVVWAAQLSRLRRAGLVTKETPERAGELDSHPLTREFFASDLERHNPEAWLEGHGRLFDHLARSTHEQPDTLHDIFPLFSAIRHGCKANRHREALRIYTERIQRTRTTWYSTKRFGIPTQHLAALSGFFDKDQVTVCANLSDTDKIYVLMETAYELRALGRLHDSIEPLKAARDHAVRLGRARERTSACDALAETYLYIGDISSALELAEDTVSAARQSEKKFEMMYAHCTLANVQHFAGHMEAAAANFAVAEEIQAVRQPKAPRLKSLNGAQYCDFLISNGKAAIALDRAREIVERLGEDDDTRIAQAICRVVMARALIKVDRAEVEHAVQLLREATITLRETRQKQELALALISRACLIDRKRRIDRGDLDAADEAYEIAQQSGSKVLRIEACHARCKLRLAGGDATSARRSAEEAKRLRDETGYRRPSICCVDTGT